MKPLLVMTLLMGGLYAGESRVEIGEINGAKFRIDVPANWNGGLVMYCHGYSTTTANFKAEERPNPRWAVFLDAG